VGGGVRDNYRVYRDFCERMLMTNMTTKELEKIKNDGARYALLRIVGSKIFRARQALEESQNDDFKNFEKKLAEVHQLITDLEIAKKEADKL
jgi:hypothetical protein